MNAQNKFQEEIKFLKSIQTENTEEKLIQDELISFSEDFGKDPNPDLEIMNLESIYNNLLDDQRDDPETYQGITEEGIESFYSKYLKGRF